MTIIVCARCGQALRLEAKFCASCGAPVQAAPSSVGAPTKIVSSALPPPATGPGQTTSAAASALPPVARQVAVKTWTGSRKAATDLAWLVTAGGRAAYTEIARPDPALEGRVTGASAERSIKTPIEPAALVFLGVTLLGWLILLLPRVYALSVLIATLLLLLVLVYIGGRRPYFSRLTLAGVVDRLTRRGAQAPYYRFDVKSPHDPQPVQVVLVGQRRPSGAQVSAGADVRVWGIPEPNRNELRAWKVEWRDPLGQRLSISTPRPIPLSLALIIPVWLLLLIGIFLPRS